MPDPLVALPEDLNTRIFQALARSSRSWPSLPLVCKRWRDFFGCPSQLWEVTRLNIPTDYPDPYLSDYIAAQVKRLGLHDLWDATESLETSTRSQACDFLEAATGAQAWLARRAPSFKNLQIKLGSMKGGDLKLIWRRLVGGLKGSQVKALCISAWQDEADDAAMAAISSLTTLECLRLSCVCTFAPKTLLPLDNLHSLQELFINFCDVPSSSETETSYDEYEDLRGLTGLRKLALGNYVPSRIMDQIVKTLTLLTKLEELNIMNLNASKLNLASLPALSALHCNSLVSCSIDEPEAFLLPQSLTRLVLLCYGSVPAVVAHSTALRFLSLYHAEFEHPSEFEDIVSSLRNLERLDLNQCGITYLPLAVAALPKLRALHISRCGFDADAFGSSPLLPRLEALKVGSGESLVCSLFAARSLKYLQVDFPDDVGEADIKVIHSLPCLKEVYWPVRFLEDGPSKYSKKLLDTCQRDRPDVKFHDGYPDPENCKIPELLYPEVEPSERYQV